MPKIRRLGTSTDNKAFIYDYGNSSKGQNMKTTKTISHLESNQGLERTSLINASKLGYNPINHAEDYAPP